MFHVFPAKVVRHVARQNFRLRRNWAHGRALASLRDALENLLGFRRVKILHGSTVGAGFPCPRDLRARHATMESKRHIAFILKIEQP